MKTAVDEAIEFLHRQPGDNIQITVPAGGYALWIKLPESMDSKQIRIKANKQQLDFLPGEFFSLESRFKNYLRLVIVPPFSGKHKIGLQKLAKLIQQNL